MPLSATERLKQAERGAILSIGTYIFLSAIKLIVGKLFNSEALFADGWNNFTDVISSVLVLVGLRVSQKPSDENHPTVTGNLKRLPALRLHLSCSLSGLKSSECLQAFLNPVTEAPSLISSIVGFFPGVVMIGVYFYNKT